MSETRPLSGEHFGHEFAGQTAGSASPDDWSDEALAQEPLVGEQAPATSAAPEPQFVEATEPVLVTDAPAQQQVVAPEPVPSTEGGQPEGTTTPGTPRKWAGKYENPEELEKGYKNVQRLHSRTQQQLQAIELQNQQLAAYLEQVKPYLQQVMDQQAALPGHTGEPIDLSELTPDQLQAIVNQQVQQATERVRNETRSETSQRVVAETVTQFMASHPDIQEGSELDDTIGELLEEFQRTPDGRRSMDLFPITHQNLDLAYQLAKDENVRDMFLDLDLKPLPQNIAIAQEAAGNPALAEVLLAQPDLVDSEHGMNHARKLAGLPGLYQNAQQQVAVRTSPEVARRAAHVETGGTGAPISSAPGAVPQPVDEFDLVIDAWKGGRSGNVFGLQVQE